MRVPMYKIGGEGQGHLEASNEVVRAFLVTLLTTEHWKNNPELIHERCLKLRRKLLQESKFVPTPQAAPEQALAS